MLLNLSPNVARLVYNNGSSKGGARVRFRRLLSHPTP
jgi:hypothetical protein